MELVKLTAYSENMYVWVDPSSADSVSMVYRGLKKNGKIKEMNGS
jgi:hypothetical protein